jgi:O-succinylbenzoate synthase
MIRIRKAVLREIHLTLREPFTYSWGTQSHRRILLLELTDADGMTGWGECVASNLPNYLPETIDVAWHSLTAWLIPRVLSHPLKGPQEVYPLLEKGVRGHTMAKAAIEMASWELEARKQGKSLSRLLSGTRGRVETGISIGIQESPKALAEKVERSLQEGYRKLKLKIRPGSDLDFVKAAREEVGPDAPLMVDANGTYSMEDLDTLRRLDTLGLMMIEQPLAWDDQLRHAELQRELQTPICLDESITSLNHAHDMLTLGSGRIINIKPGRVGGFTQSVAIHDLCMKHNIPVWCGGMLESGIGRAHNVALASLPNFLIPGDISPSRRYWERDIVTPEWTMSGDGMVEVPVDEPGMGVAVDLDHIENVTATKVMLPGSERSD